MKFFISPVMLKAQNMQTTFCKCQDQGYFVIINEKMPQMFLKIKDDIQYVLQLSCFVEHLIPQEFQLFLPI